MLSAFPTFNFALDMGHHWYRSVFSSLRLSYSPVVAVVSSTKRDSFTDSLELGMSVPLMFYSRIFTTNGPIPRLNRMHDVGSPCLTPLVALKDSLATPFNMTDVLAI